MEKDMRYENETVCQACLRELSRVSVEDVSAAAFQEACDSVLAINPIIGMGHEALHFAPQGWLAAQRHLAAIA